METRPDPEGRAGLMDRDEAQVEMVMARIMGLQCRGDPHLLAVKVSIRCFH